jgi:flagellar export protein FliJ
MKKQTQLDMARGIAEGKAQALAGEVGALIREKDDARQMLERLGEYLADYSNPGAYGGDAGTCSAFSIQNRHGFVTRLKSALEQQRARAQRIEERTRSKMQSWQRARADLEALDRLIALRARAADQDEVKREQRDADAAALRAFSAGAVKDRHFG